MTPTFDLPLCTVMDVIRGLVMALFLLSAFFVTVVVLIQEGKGGGLAGAFGGAGADAFGVKAGTVNRFTAYLAAAFLGFALLHSGLSSSSGRLDTDVKKPAPVEDTGSAPASTAPGGVPAVPVEKEAPGDSKKPPEPAGPPAGQPGGPPEAPGGAAPGGTPPEKPPEPQAPPKTPEKPPEKPPGEPVPQDPGMGGGK